MTVYPDPTKYCHKLNKLVEQSVARSTADLVVASWILAQSHTFVDIPLIQIGLLSVSYKQKYVHEVLVNHLVKLTKEKVWLGELTL